MSGGGQAAPIVVGVDGSECAARAVRWAAIEAQLRGAPLRLVHGFLWPVGRHIGDLGLAESARKAIGQQAEEWLREAGEVAHKVAPELEITREVRTLAPDALLVRESQHAQLVVLGSRGLGGLTGLLVGSVAVGVAARGHCPIVVIREEVPDDLAEVSGPVVVGVDGSPVSEAALEFAYQTAARYGESLVAVHAWLSTGGLDGVAARLLDRPEVERAGRELLAERLAGWAEKYPEVSTRRVVTRERPADALLREARQARLLVVGTRGRGSLSGLVLGSTSHALLHRATCPVAVVPQTLQPAELE